MMDPLAITTACVALIDAAAKTSTGILALVRSCRDAHSDLATINSELTALRMVLDLLREDTASTSHETAISDDVQDLVLSNIDNCTTALAKVDGVLDNHKSGNRGLVAVRWATMGKMEVAGLRAKLEANRKSLDLALHLISGTLTRAVREDTSATRADVIDIKELIPQILQRLEAIERLVSSNHVTPVVPGQIDILQRYLDDLTTYADTVCERVASDRYDTDSDCDSWKDREIEGE